ncbi:MAG TPA: OmpH family outer membrane protein [Micropepsaceae bacterium]|nr:OmpH family outer membrane protein [Micropepsaceae bacterium]
MSKTTHFRAAAAFAAFTLALVIAESHSGPADAQAAPAPAATAPGVVVAKPQTAPAVVAPAPLAAAPAPAAGAAGPGAAAPRIIVIDRNFILQRSSAGQEMITQAQNLSKQAETQFKTEEAALTTEAGQLQQQLAIMAPDVRDQKEKDFTNKQQAFQGRVQQRQAEIQAGFNKAARQLEIALEPILKAIMQERGANMVLDRTSVILSSVDIDVTPVAVQRLDKALPHVKVELTAAPAATAATAPAPRPTTSPVLTAPPAVKK